MFYLRTERTFFAAGIISYLLGRAQRSRHIYETIKTAIKRILPSLERDRLFATFLPLPGLDEKKSFKFKSSDFIASEYLQPPWISFRNFKSFLFDFSFFHDAVIKYVYPHSLNFCVGKKRYESYDLFIVPTVIALIKAQRLCQKELDSYSSTLLLRV